MKKIIGIIGAIVFACAIGINMQYSLNGYGISKFDLLQIETLAQGEGGGQNIMIEDCQDVTPDNDGIPLYDCEGAGTAGSIPKCPSTTKGTADDTLGRSCYRFV